MANLKEHIKIWRCISLALFVLFSMSSCSAKQSILNSFDLEFSGTVNKTRATGNPINSCSFVRLTNNKGAVTRSVLKSANYSGYDNNGIGLSERWLHAASPNNNAGVITGSSPPKYILFKRLKVYLA